MIYQKNIIFFIKIFFFISISIKAQFIIPDKPKKIYPINDYSRILTDKEIKELNNEIIIFNKKKSIEIVISIIDSINSRENISMIATRWAEKWKIGEKKESNGIFILLISKDKKISIQTGYGIEPYLTDIICKKIINKIIPYIKKEEYYFAIKNILNIIFNKLKYYDNKKINKINNISEIYFLLIIIIFILYIYFFNKNKKYIFFGESLMPPNIYGEYNHENNEDNNFDGFGGGGSFGGGGASSN